MAASMSASFLGVLPFLIAMTGHAAPPGDRAGAATAADPEPGISAALAQARRERIAAVAYAIELRIPDDRRAAIEGRTRVTLTLARAGDPLVLDFAAPPDYVREVVVNGTSTMPRVVNGHLVVPPRALRVGANEVVIAFRAGEAPLNRDDEFLYSLFVPARAHQALPCFDQPDVKARVSLTLEVPRGWTAVANGREVERRETAGGLRVRFAETEPLPTYLLAFAAGRLQVEEAVRAGRTLRMIHRETDAQKVTRNRDAIFDLHAAALAWLEDYTGIPYPWGKFDFFLAPAFQFSGMEHPGAIYYNAPSLLLDESATTNQLLGRASLIAHETAHMWFGDLVTMRWFDDVWMKEVFANFFAAKIVNPSFPGMDHDLRFLLSHYPGAYAVDRTAGTHPIRQPLQNLNEAGTLYGPIIYQKAPIVMRQLERLAGEERLREGLREYLTVHAFGNASWPDLIALLDRRVEVDLAAWSAAWVSEAGRPHVRTELAVDADGRVGRLALVQEDPLGRGLRWPQHLEVVVATDGAERHVPVLLDGARAEVPDATGAARPWYVLPTGGGHGYGLFALDPTSRDTLLRRLPTLPDALTRGSAWLVLREVMLEGDVPVSSIFALARRALASESDELNVQRLLSDVVWMYWRFLAPAEREAQTADLERLLQAGLARAAEPRQKAAWFQALARVARRPDTLRWLTGVWRQEIVVPGLTLGEPDYTALAQELAVREVPGWREILARQEQRITNPDRRAQFAFVRPALDADPAVRDAFFASLADPAQRRREPWVLEAVTYLHHPLRAAHAERYVAPSLALLDEIQRTGDIFFPRRWMDATLSGHRAPGVAETVRRFLAEAPALRPRLRQIVLQAADELFRAVTLEGRASD